MKYIEEKCPICDGSTIFKSVIDLDTKSHRYDVISCNTDIEGVKHQYVKYKYITCSEEEIYHMSGYRITNRIGKTYIFNNKTKKSVYSGVFNGYFRTPEEIRNFLLL